MRYIRHMYGVPAKIGGRVRYEGQEGTIVGAKKGYLQIVFDGKKFVLSCVPTDVEYIDAEKGPPVKTVEMRRETVVVSVEVEIEWNGDARGEAVSCAENMVLYVEKSNGVCAKGQFSAKPVRGSVRTKGEKENE